MFILQNVHVCPPVVDTCSWRKYWCLSYRMFLSLLLWWIHVHGVRLFFFLLIDFLVFKDNLAIFKLYCGILFFYNFKWNLCRLISLIHFYILFLLCPLYGNLYNKYFFCRFACKWMYHWESLKFYPIINNNYFISYSV